MLSKLKREWKTFALAVATTLVGLHDTLVMSGYDWTPIIPEEYRPYAIPLIGLAFLLLRQYKDADPE